MYKRNQGKNGIFWYLKYIIMFANMQYYFAYLSSTDQKIAVSLWCGTLINKMAVSDETSLISRQVECMGLPVVHCRSNLLQVDRATDKVPKSVITHWKSLKTHWKYNLYYILGVKIRISILRYALGVQCSAYWLSIHVLKKSKTLDYRCQSVCPFVIILSKYGQYILKCNNK